MYCSRCGAALSEAAVFCQQCGSPVPARGPVEPAPGPPAVPPEGFRAGPDAEPGAVPRPPEPGSMEPTWRLPGNAPRSAAPHYAGFWRRFGGLVLDKLILGAVLFPLQLGVLWPLLSVVQEEGDLPPGGLAPYFGTMLALACFGVILQWTYAALLQSSSRQATLGQMALGLRVTNLAGRPISFAQATGRYFATLLTGLTFGIGYLMVLFTARRQTLHDLLAGTLVVR